MKTVISKSIGKPFLREELKLSQNSFKLKMNTITGKDGEFWVCIAPSINVSGYGDTPAEAQTSFEHNMDVLNEDLNKISLLERIDYFKGLGWEQKHYFKRQFSKAFIDGNGMLQGLEHAQINSLESVA